MIEFYVRRRLFSGKLLAELQDKGIKAFGPMFICEVCIEIAQNIE